MKQRQQNAERRPEDVSEDTPGDQQAEQRQHRITAKGVEQAAGRLLELAAREVQPAAQLFEPALDSGAHRLDRNTEPARHLPRR